jgi:hypothetical protein
MRNLNWIPLVKLVKRVPNGKAGNECPIEISIRNYVPSPFLLLLVGNGIIFASKFTGWIIQPCCSGEFLCGRNQKKPLYNIERAYIETGDWKPSKKYNGRGIENKS